MYKRRIRSHPVISIIEKKPINFFFNGKKMLGKIGEVISSALIANGIDIFGHHQKDGAPLGIFCANGQCAQCTVIVDGVSKKACMTELKENMKITSCEGLPELPTCDRPPKMSEIATVRHDVLIIGGGPAGLSAAVELGQKGIDTLLIDDKSSLGGKLLLQTHKFFGSIDDCYAGTRGFIIAQILQEKVSTLNNIKIWTDTTAIGIFSDKKIGVLQNGEYRLIEPKHVLMATGAREKMLTFPGNTLPGVYGAGAFQTLVNRDLVKACKRLFIIGGGNVGLIAGYHAIQAEIEVIGLVEALPKCGGYKVHEDKLRRLGVPIFNSHTILSANGKERVESITISQIDKNFKPIQGTERTYEVDTILIAVGLSPVNELYIKSKEFGFNVYSAGDADEIAEASSAMFSGKIAAQKILRALGKVKGEIPKVWEEKANILKSMPGKIIEREEEVGMKAKSKVYPVFHCTQEIPCNPCTSVCPQNGIQIADGSITGLPYFTGEEECRGCLRCVAVCPGLAVTLVDTRKDKERPLVTLPFEAGEQHIQKGAKVIVTDCYGDTIAETQVEKIITLKDYKETKLVQVKLSDDNANRAVGIRLQEPEVTEPSKLYFSDLLPDDAIICRCERVTAGEIRNWIKLGIRDLNQLKAISRAGMGACGSKTCRELIYRLFKEEGIKFDEITDRIDRPLFIEVPLGAFANANPDQSGGGN